jgi:DNA-binding XRE family transcriptional regulator
MANDRDKPRTYRTNGDAARRAREAAGFTQAAAAEEWEIGERTIRDIESGRGASTTKIRIFAEKCGLKRWHDLLAEDEKQRLGLEAMRTLPSRRWPRPFRRPP